MLKDKKKKPLFPKQRTEATDDESELEDDWSDEFDSDGVTRSEQGTASVKSETPIPESSKKLPKSRVAGKYRKFLKQ